MVAVVVVVGGHSPLVVYLHHEFGSYYIILRYRIEE